MSDTMLLRIGIAIALSLLFGAIIFFGRGRKSGQGRRVQREASTGADGRLEPSLGEQLADSWGEAPARQEDRARALIAVTCAARRVAPAFVCAWRARCSMPAPLAAARIECCEPKTSVAIDRLVPRRQRSSICGAAASLRDEMSIAFC